MPGPHGSASEARTSSKAPLVGAPYAPGQYAYGEVSHSFSGPRTQNRGVRRLAGYTRSIAGASATGATSRPARSPRCSRLPSPFASTRSAEGEPGTQVGLLEQGYAAAQVARGVAERAAVPRNGKREARDASRSTSRSS
jgi:hypothetical protein